MNNVGFIGSLWWPCCTCDRFKWKYSDLIYAILFFPFEKTEFSVQPFTLLKLRGGRIRGLKHISSTWITETRTKKNVVHKNIKIPNDVRSSVHVTTIHKFNNRKNGAMLSEKKCVLYEMSVAARRIRLFYSVRSLVHLLLPTEKKTIPI